MIFSPRTFYLNTAPFRFVITTDCESVCDNLSTIYGTALDSERAGVYDYHVSLLRSKGIRYIYRPQARFFSDQKEPFKPLALHQSYAFLEWGMNWVIALNEMEYVIIHSAVLAKGESAVLFPAPPGSGKSTLTAFLAFNGWRLLSDEMTLIVPNTLTTVPYVRPICLKNQSIALARTWFPQGRFSTVAMNTHKGDVIHLSPPEESWANKTRPATIRAVVFPRFQADANLTIYQLDQTTGFMSLAENSINFGLSGAPGFHTLTQVMESVPCFEVEYSDLNELKAFLEEDVL